MYFSKKFILKSIKTKDSRQNTIVAYKQYHGLTMIEAKQEVDNILAQEEMEIDMSELYKMEMFFTSEKTQIFSEEEIIYQKEQEKKKKHIDEAKAWYETLSIRDRKRIDWLIEDKKMYYTAGFAMPVG